MKNNNMNNESVTRRLVYNLSEVLRSSTPANDYLQIIIALLLIKRMDGRLIPYYSSIRNAFVHGANISDSSIKESHGGLPFIIIVVILCLQFLKSQMKLKIGLNII